MSCIWFISAVVLLSLVPRLFYPELHTDSCVSIAQHHANTTALYSALSAELQQQVANAEETMSKFEELFETTKASRQRQEEVSNNIEKIRARLDLLNSKQEALLMRQSEIKITADEIFEYSVSQANKMEYQLQSALTKVTGERDIAQAKVIELKMTGSRLQNIRNMASTLLHFAANVKAKSEEQSQSLQIALAEVASRRDEVYSCPQPSPEKRSLDDESIVSLITERIIQNITSRTAEAKLHQLPPLRPPPPPRHPPDYALFAAGSKILRQQTSSTYFHPTLRVDQQIKEFLGTLGTPFNALGDLVPPISGRSFLDFFHLEAMMNLGTPEDAITTDMSIGACWPMEGSTGNLTVQLFTSITVGSVSIDHIKRAEAVNIESAPRHFEVYGSTLAPDGTTTEAIVLVRGKYSINSSESVQTFHVPAPLDTPIDTPLDTPHSAASTAASTRTFNLVTLHILDNYGFDYTCLYRFRVHPA